MKNIFKRKKKEEKAEPVEIPMHIAVGEALGKLMNLQGAPEVSTYELFRKYMDNNGDITVFEFCRNSDSFPITLLLDNLPADRDSIIHLLNEISGLEILSSSYSGEEKEILSWRTAGKSEILSGPENSFFIIVDKREERETGQDCLSVNNNREFFFGALIAGDMEINNSPLSLTYKRLCFNPGITEESNLSSFRTRIKLGEKEIETGLVIKGTGPIVNAMAKELFRSQARRLGEYLNQDGRILSGKSVASEEVCQMGDYSIEGEIFTSGGRFPYTVFFPRKLINLMPDQVCSTVKGKILQVNNLLFKENFSSFHKSHDRFLFTDLLSHLPHRDLNLICQNFFISQSLRGDDLRTLIRYLVRREEKSIILKLPFPSEEEMVKHLPGTLKEEYLNSKSYSPSYKDLLSLHKNILRELYSQISQGKLLLSPKALLILERETGKEMKEGKMLRLKKLMSDKRYLQALARLDKKRTQVLLGNMNHIWLADTFVYQTDQLPLVKPYLSRTRFNELMEDVRFTQKKIKSGQIDINRIGDSMENFNKEVRLFVEKEKERTKG